MRRQQHASTPLNSVGHFRFKRIELQIELGGDGGQADIAINTGQQLALTGALLKDRGIGGKVLTHGNAL